MCSQGSLPHARLKTLASKADASHSKGDACLAFPDDLTQTLFNGRSHRRSLASRQALGLRQQ